MTTWPYVKALMDAGTFLPHYSEDATWYHIKVYNGPVFLAECQIHKLMELEYKEQFETSYKPYGNRKIVTQNGDIRSSDGLRNGGVYGALTLTTANTAYEAKVNSNRLARRKSLTIYAEENMYWGYSNEVTTSTGTPLFKNQSIVFCCESDSTFQVWLVCASASKVARITESP